MQKYQIEVLSSHVAYWDNKKQVPKTLILIHGYRGTHHGLARIADELADFRLIIPDLPGFGESTAFDGAHSVQAYAKFIHEFIGQLALDSPPILIGHSFGSILVSHFAADHPSDITKLILINPIAAPALKGPRGIFTQFARLYYGIGKILPETFGRQWLSWTLVTDIMSVTMTKSRDQKMRAYVKDQHRQYFSRFASAHVASEGFDASVSSDVSTVARDIPVPTLLIAGEKDDITHLDKNYALQKLFPNAQLSIIPDVGHLTHYEKAADVAANIRTFIA